MQDFLDGIRSFWDTLPAPARAAVLVALITACRYVYDDDRRKWRRKLAEGGICICSTWGFGEGAKAVGLPVESAYLFAVAIGWYGADWVRENAREWLKRKTGEGAE